MAKEEVDACAGALGRVRGPAQEEVLDPEPLVRGVAGLDPVATAVLEARAVMLAPLPAPLLEEASYSGAARVLDVPAPVRDLEPPELDHGRDVSVDRALREEGALQGRLCGRREGHRGHVALAVVCEELCHLRQRHLERLG